MPDDPSLRREGRGIADQDGRARDAAGPFGRHHHVGQKPAIGHNDLAIHYDEIGQQALVNDEALAA